MDNVRVDVAVVGAGLAGLVAARELRRGGARVHLLEARDRVGGRLLNVELGDGTVVEIGGQWVGPTQHRVAQLGRELGLETFPTYAQGHNLIEWGSRLIRYRGAIPRINLAVLLDVAQARARLDRMARTVPLEAPWQATNADRWDNQTFWSWIKRNTTTRGARKLLELAAEAVWAASAADLSLLHVLFYTHSAGGFDLLIGTEGGAQQDRYVGGSQLLATRLHAQLDDCVRLSTPVFTIEHGSGDIRINAKGAAIKAAAAIIAIPPVLCGRLSYDPPLPGLRDQLTQRMPQGSVIKCMAVYTEPFWRQEGLSGQATSVNGPVKVMFDNSPSGGTPGVLLGFLEGRQARLLAQWTPAQRRRTVIGCFVRVFGQRAADPDQYVEKIWPDDQWSRGCYGCYMPPGGWATFGTALRSPVGHIHWAGSETATEWAGYMDGAIQSGQRAAGEVLAQLGFT
jgi:monoamine oxidase